MTRRIVKEDDGGAARRRRNVIENAAIAVSIFQYARERGRPRTEVNTVIASVEHEKTAAHKMEVWDDIFEEHLGAGASAGVPRITRAPTADGSPCARRSRTPSTPWRSRCSSASALADSPTSSMISASAPPSRATSPWPWEAPASPRSRWSTLTPPWPQAASGHRR